MIDKLVIRFDKDVLKPERWAALNASIKEKETMAELEKIDPKEINILRPVSRQDSSGSGGEATSRAMVLENASKLINDDDYEIYVLKDSNEIIEKLENVESVFDSETGAISKRRSIENYSANVLPSSINVFFKIDEENERE